MQSRPPAQAPLDLGRLLRPRSVAIVGASETRGALGTSVLANLERNGFSGEIHLINPKREEIGGRPCVKRVEDLPEGVDVAVLAIPHAAVLEALRGLAARKAGAAIIFSAGFAESGAAGVADQQEIARIAQAAGMTVEGPNCLGLVNYVEAIPLTFVETRAPKLGAREGVGIVSQSGAMAAVLATTLASRELGLSYSISTGNEAASGVEDYVEHLAADPSTRVIAMIVEQFRNPRRFLAAASAAAAAGKTIVLLHPGKSAAARRSAATHTGAMAGDYQVMRTLVEHAGVVFAETLEELGDVAEIALRCPVRSPAGAAVVGESGAFKALSLDLCEELGLDLPLLGDADSPALRAALPEFAPVSNPLDLTAQGLVDPDLYRRTLAALYEDARIGAVVMGIIQTDPATMNVKAPPILQALRERTSDKTLVFAGLDEGAPLPDGFVTELRSLGVPYFPSAERALRAVGRLIARAGRDLAGVWPATAGLDLRGARGVIPEHRAKALLAPLGVPVPLGWLAATLREAQAAADAIGYPVALKAQAAELAHKSDIGGVVLGCRDADDIARGWRELCRAVARYRPDLALDGVLVERMGGKGVELIIGGRNDPDWGAIVLVGFGGVQAEVLHDVRVLPPNLPRAAVVAELHKLKCSALLRGFRGSPPLDVEAVADVVAAIAGALVATPAIREIDLNPVVVRPAGQGVLALDALILSE